MMTIYAFMTFKVINFCLNISLPPGCQSCIVTIKLRKNNSRTQHWWCFGLNLDLLPLVWCLLGIRDHREWQQTDSRRDNDSKSHWSKLPLPAHDVFFKDTNVCLCYARSPVWHSKCRFSEPSSWSSWRKYTQGENTGFPGHAPPNIASYWFHQNLLGIQ